MYDSTYEASCIRLMSDKLKYMLCLCTLTAPNCCCFSSCGYDSDCDCYGCRCQIFSQFGHYWIWRESHWIRDEIKMFHKNILPCPLHDRKYEQFSLLLLLACAWLFASFHQCSLLSSTLDLFFGQMFIISHLFSLHCLQTPLFTMRPKLLANARWCIPSASIPLSCVFCSNTVRITASREKKRKRKFSKFQLKCSVCWLNPLPPVHCLNEYCS